MEGGKDWLRVAVAVILNPLRPRGSVPLTKLKVPATVYVTWANAWDEEARNNKIALKATLDKIGLRRLIAARRSLCDLKRASRREEVMANNVGLFIA